MPRGEPTVTNAIRVIFFLFAALLILGGIAGYAEKKSVISLIAGVVCGGLGLYAALNLATRPTLALVIGLVAAILSLGGMAPRLKSKTTGQIVIWPAAIVVAMSAIAALTAGAGLLAGRNPTP
jgi:uncharacterized membrane protein (UPF0136 family)